MDDLLNLETLPPETETGTAVALLEATTLIAFTDKAKHEKLYADVEQEIADFVPDVTTDKGRKAVASLAFKVTKLKAGIDKAGLKLTEEARSQIDLVNASRRDIKARLEALADQAREPLTKWEEAEEKRIDYAKRMIVHIENVGKGLIGGEPQAFGILFHELDEKINISDLAEFEPAARKAMETARELLTVSYEAHKRAAADRAELERFRAAEAERLAQEEARAEAKRIAAERVAEAQRLADEAKEREVAAERAKVAEAERLAQAAEQARLAAIAEQQAKAKAEQDQRDREHAQALADAKRRADEAEAARMAEAKRIEDERLAKEKADRLAREADEKRQRDQKHRSQIMSAAKEALMQHADIPEDIAKRVVLAITGGNVPAVSIQF
ncbi:hypothetical protein [Asticcacaulis endophyticus]|uniref:DUF1351 domain-containing protein n=1 Tax=Asticcacaulis endophyticus TaxID=1395890 RepID=A0A918UMB1_9CAUL|nr:hypothetical protein [Asticcacaulis endophyticus]GGZ22007.1 hypothetical protein GCM10011273_03520 [Asticcacaulis endophyticus]